MMALMKDKQDLSKFWRTKKKDSNNEASKLINITIFLFLLCVCVWIKRIEMTHERELKEAQRQIRNT